MVVHEVMNVRTKGVRAIGFAICEICSNAPPKYKCPSCNLKYCSVGCFKVHKGNRSCENFTKQKNEGDRKRQKFRDTQVAKESGEVESGSGSESDNEDRVKPDVLEKLEHSPSLRAMLQNRHLQEMINNIDSSQKPEKCLQESMQVPIFSEFVDVCLGVVQPHLAEEER